MPCVAPAKRRACCPTAPIIAHGICGSASGDGAGPSVDGLGLLTHLPRNVSIAMGRAANAGVGESLSTKHALLATGHLTTMMGRENCRHRARELRNPCVAQARVLHRGRKAGGHCRNPETSPLAACSEHDGQNCTGPPRMVPGRWQWRLAASSPRAPRHCTCSCDAVLRRAARDRWRSALRVCSRVSEQPAGRQSARCRPRARAIIQSSSSKPSLSGSKAIADRRMHQAGPRRRPKQGASCEKTPSPAEGSSNEVQAAASRDDVRAPLLQASSRAHGPAVRRGATL